MKVLVTGAAGFIGFHVTQRLLARGDEVVGVDNLNDYYDPQLKLARLAVLEGESKFSFEKLDIADRDAVMACFKRGAFDRVINLAAQAGVRYSLENPHTYIDSNVMGFTNILEGCRHHDIEHLVYASTSSVYGANAQQPFSESQGVNHPMALYAATKRANELMAHAYGSLFGLPTTGLRFFTVYGPWGRPDMALFKFTRNILAGKPIDVFNHGQMTRDFTYVSDIVSGIVCAVDKVAMPDPAWTGVDATPDTSYAPFRIYNIGNSNPTPLMDYIRAVERALGREAKLNMMPMQAGDVPSTSADVTKLVSDLGYRPAVSVEEGVNAFVEWYQAFYADAMV